MLDHHHSNQQTINHKTTPNSKEGVAFDLMIEIISASKWFFERKDTNFYAKIKDKDFESLKNEYFKLYSECLKVVKAEQ